MKQRVISGIFLLAGLLFLIFLAPFPVFFLAFLAIAILSIWEYSKLIYNHNPNLEPNRRWNWLYITVISVATIFPFFPVATLYFTQDTEMFSQANLAFKKLAENSCFYAMFIWLFSFVIYRKTEVLMYIMHPRLVTIFAALVNGSFFSSLFAVRFINQSTLNFDFDNSATFILYIFCLVACADSGAYFIGRAIGKTKMSPKISPNKTLEGLLGGMLSACLCALIFIYATDLGQYMHNARRLMAFIMLSMLAVILAVHGDLTESFLKRRAGVKDSSNLIPGHGGVLDRLDSLQPAFMFMAYYWLFLTLGNFFTW